MRRPVGALALVCVLLAALTYVPASAARPHAEEGRSILEGAAVLVPSGLRPRTPPSRVAVLVARGRGTTERIESLTLFRDGLELQAQHPEFGCCLARRLWLVRAHGEFFVTHLGATWPYSAAWFFVDDRAGETVGFAVP
jgi:hypothetical protein